MTPANQHDLADAYKTAREALLAEIGNEPHWTGELATSALSTATAVCALALVERETQRNGLSFAPLVGGGLEWLAKHQNDDGGWGDTTKSLSNIATTMLGHAAFAIAGKVSDFQQIVDAAVQYIDSAGGTEAVRARYGKDRTFAVPILTTAALAGLVDWREVSPLPFELACLPQSWFHRINLPVVSYALPALIAVGQVRFANSPPRNPLIRVIRRAAVERSLRVLQRIQPTSGGFLEAAPLTSFVTMSLAGMGRADHPVARRGIKFLVDSVRPDGSWPIDSNLSIWLTTLSTCALSAGGPLDDNRFSPAGQTRWQHVHDWLLTQQYRTLHPYTNSAPGGWGWTHLPGSVPDADDTAGALLALACLPQSSESRGAARRGILWLLDLQNRDGGWPTFCRGWGYLPFDRSGSDLTAHVLRALEVWRQEGLFHPSDADEEETPRKFSQLVGRVNNARTAGLSYLAKQQRRNGSWVPLWFGNQHVVGEENPTYGTARVLAAYRDLKLVASDAARRGFQWLRRIQNADGGWGGDQGVPSSIEETALAIEALLADVGDHESADAVWAGVDRLCERVSSGGLDHPTPIGFYFAKLWYYEKLYPLIFTVAALGRARRSISTDEPEVTRSKVQVGD